MNDMRPYGALSSSLKNLTLDRRRLLLGSLAVAAGGSLLSACGGGEDGTKPTSTVLKYRGNYGLGSLDPGDWTNSDDLAAGSTIFETLIGYKIGGTDWVTENRLAEKFESSADGLRHDFTLKQGVMFHGDYGELTAEDVKFSFERLRDGKQAYSTDWQGLASVEIKDTYSGTIVMKQAYAPLLTSVLPWIAGHVVSKKAVEKLGDKFAANPIGTGAYEFAGSVPKRSITLKRFDNWHGSEKPHFAEIQIVVTPDDTAARNAFTTGTLDAGPIALADVDRMKSGGVVEVLENTTLNYGWIGMNVQQPKLKDVNVRMAIRQAIDVPSILEAVFEGKWDRASAILPPGMPVGFWKDAPVYDRDVDKAKAYLETAGVSDLSLKFSAYNSKPGAADIGQIVQANLADIGITVEIVNTDYIVGEEMRANELFYMSYEGTAPDPDSAFRWFQTNQQDLYNMMYWSDERYDELVTTSVSEPDPVKRAAMCVEMQQLWDEAAHTQWVAWPASYQGTKTGIKPALLPDGSPALWGYGAA